MLINDTRRRALRIRPRSIAHRAHKTSQRRHVAQVSFCVVVAVVDFISTARVVHGHKSILGGFVCHVSYLRCLFVCVCAFGDGDVDDVDNTHHACCVTQSAFLFSCARAALERDGRNRETARRCCRGCAPSVWINDFNMCRPASTASLSHTNHTHRPYTCIIARNPPHTIKYEIFLSIPCPVCVCLCCLRVLFKQNSLMCV